MMANSVRVRTSKRRHGATSTVIAVSVFTAISVTAAAAWLKIGWHAIEPWRGQGRTTTFLIGPWDPDRLYTLAVLMGLAAWTVLFGTLIVILKRHMPPGAARPLVIGLLSIVCCLAGLVGNLYLLATWFQADGNWVAIEGDTNGRDLLIREDYFGGAVFERDGDLLTLVGMTGTDDGYCPFVAGKYGVAHDAYSVTLSWSFLAGGASYGTKLVLPDDEDPPTYDGIAHYEQVNP